MPVRLVVSLLIALALLACAGSAPGASPSPATPSPRTIELQRAPDNLGCDAIGVEYTSATIHIDVDAAPQVWAESNLGTPLEIRWSAGFEGGDATDPVVRGPDGKVVARDGDVVTLDAWPGQAGYFGCPSPGALYVLEQQPG